jgi:G:T-mismatch repair DNA endonuclease (very short patch repair protein)
MSETLETYIPKTSTQIKTYRDLLDLLTRDGGELIGTYSNITLVCPLVLRCKCGNKFEKGLKQLKITGIFCKPCMSKNASKKREATLLAEHGVTNISQLQSTKEKKHNTASSNGNIMTKSEWLKSIKAKGIDAYWDYLFDEINGYDSPHPMRHKKCGKITEKSPRSHLGQDEVETNGQGCTHCYHNTRRMKGDEFKRLSLEKYGPNKFKDYESIPEFIPNNRTLLKLYCIIHGRFTTNYDTHLHGAGGCLPCSNNQKTVKEILNTYGESLLKNGVELIFDGIKENEIIGMNNPYPARCLKNINHPIWYPLLANITKLGTCCPHCSNGRQYSEEEIEWLNFIAIKNSNIRTALSEGGQYRIGERKLKVDGYCEDKKIVYEFHGCYYHGCNYRGCKRFKNREEYNKKVNKTYGELYDDTIEKILYIKSCGYQCIEIWEHEWKNAKRSVKIIQKKWRTRRI